jgi:hypothetical protein
MRGKSPGNQVIEIAGQQFPGLLQAQTIHPILRVALLEEITVAQLVKGGHVMQVLPIGVEKGSAAQRVLMLFHHPHLPGTVGFIGFSEIEPTVKDPSPEPWQPSFYLQFNGNQQEALGLTQKGNQRTPLSTPSDFMPIKMRFFQGHHYGDFDIQLVDARGRTKIFPVDKKTGKIMRSPGQIMQPHGQCGLVP